MGGAPPKTMLNFSNALVNSRIHYSTIPTKLNKQNANIIQILLKKYKNMYGIHKNCTGKCNSN